MELGIMIGGIVLAVIISVGLWWTNHPRGGRRRK